MKIVRIVVIALLLGIGSGILAFGPRSETEPPAGMTKIQYWEKWTGEEARQMRIIVDDFNASVGKEKKIYVEYMSMSTVDQKTLVATAGGVPPDVAGLWSGQIPQFAAMDALEPLDEMAAAHGITREYYKPVYWDACKYGGKLWGLISTPCVIGLHWNKEIFHEHAAELRAAGFDPDRPPQTLQELDKYAEILTTYENIGGKKRIKTSGHLPLEPGWYVAFFPYWFGGDVFNSGTGKLDLTTKPVVDAFDWIASYSRKYGKDSINEFRSGLGGFNSPENPFLTGAVAMEQQGPWMANYIEVLAPQMNRWHVPSEKLKREKDYAKLETGMALDDVEKLLGAGTLVHEQNGVGRIFTWDAGIKKITCVFSPAPESKLLEKKMELLPALERRKYCQWGAAPFPSAVPGKKLVGYADFDVLVIPRGSKHKKEAFEFLAYVNRQDVCEKLNMMHCKNSQLAKVSRNFIDNHPNPYIEVFEELARSPNAFAVPRLPIWAQVADELTVASQKCYMLQQTPRQAMSEAQQRCESSWEYFKKVQAKRRAEGMQ